MASSEFQSDLVCLCRKHTFTPTVVLYKVYIRINEVPARGLITVIKNSISDNSLEFVRECRISFFVALFVG